MTVLAWIVEGTWPACVDAVRAHAPESVDVVLLHVSGQNVAGAARGAYAGLMGRGHPAGDPGPRLEQMATSFGQRLLHAAAERLDRPCTQWQRSGRIEREVVAAAEGAELLVLARDGDRTRLGPRSLGAASRFVVDHAPCPVLLVWPEPAPGIGTIPPAPEHLPGHPPPHPPGHPPPHPPGHPPDEPGRSPGSPGRPAHPPRHG
jgi:nucleotide-binding universal stress UspA family protein